MMQIQDPNITKLFEEVKVLAVNNKLKKKKKIELIRNSFKGHYVRIKLNKIKEKWIISKENVWYKKYDIELKKRQFLESKVERIESRCKILERETEKFSMKTQKKNTQILSENQMNLDMTKSKFSLDESQQMFNNFRDELKPPSFAESSKEGDDCFEQKECLLCGNNLHPIYESLDVTRSEVSLLKGTIASMEKQGLDLIKKNNNLTKDMKLMERENKSLDSMVNRMTKNMDFLMEQNEKMKQMYKDEIERLKTKIEFLEDFRKKKEERKQNKENGQKNGDRMSIQSALSVTNELNKLMKINEELEKENQFLKSKLESPELLLDEFRNKEDYQSIFTQGSFKVLDFRSLEASQSLKRVDRKKTKKVQKLKISGAVNAKQESGKRGVMRKSLNGSQSARARYAEYAGTEDSSPYCALI